METRTSNRNPHPPQTRSLCQTKSSLAHLLRSIHLPRARARPAGACSSALPIIILNQTFAVLILGTGVELSRNLLQSSASCNSKFQIFRNKSFPLSQVAIAPARCAPRPPPAPRRLLHQSECTGSSAQDAFLESLKQLSHSRPPAPQPPSLPVP